jgi:hypothetical protein
MSPHRSSSEVQGKAEAIIRDKLAAIVGTELAPAAVTFDTGARVQVDAVADDESVLAEIFARQGKLKGGQQKKVAIDTLKLITLGRSRPDAELILVFADHDAAAYALGRGWLAEALTTWKVRVEVIEIDDSLRDQIRAAQARQEMVNLDDGEDPLALS